MIELSFEALGELDHPRTVAPDCQQGDPGPLSGGDEELSFEMLDETEDRRPATAAEQRARKREISGADAELSFGIISDLVAAGSPTEEADAAPSASTEVSQTPDTEEMDTELTLENTLPTARSHGENGRKPARPCSPTPVESPQAPGPTTGAVPTARTTVSVEPKPGPDADILGRPAKPTSVEPTISHPIPPEETRPEAPSFLEPFRSLPIPPWAAVALAMAIMAGLLWILYQR
jgi:hypothetical protein